MITVTVYSFHVTRGRSVWLIDLRSPSESPLVNYFTTGRVPYAISHNCPALHDDLILASCV